MTSLSLSLETLNRTLPAELVARGRTYADEGRVSELRRFSGQHRYAAKVQGTRAEPYRVEAQLVKGSHGTMIYGLCTCPVRVNCKHVAATLLKAIDDPLIEEIAGTPAPALPAQKPRTPQAPGLPLDLSQWLESARRPAQSGAESANTVVDSPQRLLYVLNADARFALSKPGLKLVCARKLKSGGFGRPVSWSNVRQALDVPPRFVSGEDQRIFRMLLIDGRNALGGEFALQGESGAAILRAVLATGRCHWTNTDSPPLREGPRRPGTAAWAFSASGVQRVVFEAKPGADMVLPLSPPWYVDAKSRACGALDTGLPAAVVELLAQAPEVAPEHAAIAREALAAGPNAADMPLPVVPDLVDRRDVVPVPCLRLLTMQVFEGFRSRYRSRDEYLDIAALAFDYAGVRAGRDSPGMLTGFKDGAVLRIKRDQAAEKQAHAALTGAGFVKVMNVAPFYPHSHKQDYTLAYEPAWLDFMVSRLPNLRAQGWRIDCDESFR
ncbi:MAG: hypothetical protein ABI619_14390, partial [Betaproteobacteria bacterium]